MASNKDSQKVRQHYKLATTGKLNSGRVSGKAKAPMPGKKKGK